MPVGTVEALGSGEEGSVADDVGVGCACQRAVPIPVVGRLRAVCTFPIVHRGIPEEHIVGVVCLSIDQKEEHITVENIMDNKAYLLRVVCLRIERENVDIRKENAMKNTQWKLCV